MVTMEKNKSPIVLSKTLKFLSKSTLVTMKTLLSGTISSFIARMAIAPLERVIILKQTNEITRYLVKGKNNFLPTIIYSIFKKEGI